MLYIKWVMFLFNLSNFLDRCESKISHNCSHIEQEKVKQYYKIHNKNLEIVLVLPNLENVWCYTFMNITSIF